VSKMNLNVIDEQVLAPRPSHAERPSSHLLELWPAAIKQATARHNGANYYRCALQVNTPFQDSFKGFDSRHRRGAAAFQRDYALALAKHCKKFGISVVGICDHNNVEYVQAIRHELGQEGITVFPGFEVASTEGLHILCLFNPDVEIDDLDHLLTELGLPPKERWLNGKGLAPSQSPLAFPQIIERVQRNREGICIAAHVDRENGLLNECAKTTRVQYYTDPNLRAAQIAGRREDLVEFYRKIVDGELNHYRREQPIALLNCLDVYNLKDIGKPECCTLIRMSSPSIEGLWQAFLDPDSRLRLLSEETPKPHAELVVVGWEGGFLGENAMRFNENLNCLIGGRGTGKSTFIESLRYVLDLPPLGEEARAAHARIVEQVLKKTSQVSLLVRSHHPAPCWYVIERSYDEAPAIRGEYGEKLDLQPREILAGLEILGQHEISEIARDPAKQYHLLQRFRDPQAADLETRKKDLLHQLQTNRLDLLKAKKEIDGLEEKLSRLPVLEEKLRRFQEQDVEEKLKTQSRLAKEESMLKLSREKLLPIKKSLEQLRQNLAFDYAFLDTAAAGELPNTDLWARLERAFEKLEEQMQQSLTEMNEAVQETEEEFLEASQEWETRRQAKRGALEKMLRELQKEDIDGDAFMKLRKEYELLAPLKNERRKLEQRLQELETLRQQVVHEWEETKTGLFEHDQAAAEKISRELAEHGVRASVVKEGNSAPLIELLKRYVKGTTAFERLKESHLVSLADFIQHLREGKEVLDEIYGFPPKTLEKLTNLPPQVLLEMEELELPNRLELALNISKSPESPNWKPMHELSVGQKATVVLLLLLSDSDMPLIIDQPEDDLDNSFIAKTVIPKLRQAKRRRQFIFATHNANLPVLGDAELIVALEATGEGKTGQARILDDHLGSIDTTSVKLLVEQILEGGKQAFETRRAKYGF